MNHRSVRGRLFLVAFLALCLLIITLDYRTNETGPIERAKEVAITIVTPLQRGITVVARPVGNFFSSVAEVANLRDENSRLKKELQQAKVLNEGSEGLLQQNERLRRLFDLQKSWAAMDRVEAEVVGNAPSNYKYAVQIDKGRSDGVRPDMAVIDPNGSLVGKVIKVTNAAASVQLLIDPAAAAYARIEGADESGLVEGAGSSDNLEFSLADSDARVSVDAEVVTSSYNNGIYPAGISVGVVAEVKDDGRHITKKIEVAPSVNFRNLDFVAVLTESGPRLASREGR
jgi:rod shape-determining protein MreC